MVLERYNLPRILSEMVRTEWETVRAVATASTHWGIRMCFDRQFLSNVLHLLDGMGRVKVSSVFLSQLVFPVGLVIPMVIASLLLVMPVASIIVSVHVPMR